MSVKGVPALRRGRPLETCGPSTKRNTSGEDQLKKFLRNLLALCDFGDFDGLPGVLRGEIEDGLQGILAFDGDVHRENRRQPPIKAERAGDWEGPARFDARLDVGGTADDSPTNA
jgi:hypothetical protein